MRKWRQSRERNWRQSRDRKWPMVGSNVSNVTGSDVISPRFFLTIVVVQNIPLLFIIRFTISDYSFGIFWSLCCLSFDLWLLIIPLVSSSFPCKGTFCTTTVFIYIYLCPTCLKMAKVVIRSHKSWEAQTIKWWKEKEQNDKQWSTKHLHVKKN
jgi:hypothetical protein